VNGGHINPIGGQHLAAQLAILQAFKHFKLDPASNVHGLPHWSRVWTNGCEIARIWPTFQASNSSINLDVIAWFAFLHDSCRLNDGADPEHGLRASLHIDELRQADH